MTTNCSTHTGLVHSGRVHADGRLVPACFSNTQVSNLHFAAPSDREISCKRCLAGIKAREEAAEVTTYAKASAEAASVRTQGEETRKVIATGPEGVVVVRVATVGEPTVWTLHFGSETAPCHFVAITRKEALKAAGL